ncbi:hypothetical protein [Xanthomonas campestris]|uniref:hypothetical protein n=1 Tax=Xanthomonas campestris TaxID=339 RepID=UPI0020C9411B|nr:hypothetical protein [Xanthomonas campestris]MDM7717900.1 hypothetical protein [Xanthomonas campestris pv. campestris]MEA0952250.1 hypothetical protein [Xanthomonas campestris pv. campestris]MEB1105317.1 hypothetical protein [Xanthomonas campestris pv. campestris]MEB1623130.1 hypothetical protein [Xanthomonas campestris pv. campestris]
MSTEPRPLDPEKLLDVLKSIDRSLFQLAAAARLPHVYPDTQRDSLKEELGKLKYADKAADENLTEANNEVSKDGLTYDQRVNKLGEPEAERIYAPVRQATQAKRAGSSALAKFRGEHPLILAVVDGTRS